MSDLVGYTTYDVLSKTETSLVQRAKSQTDGRGVLLKTPTRVFESVDRANRYQHELELFRSFKSDLVIRADSVEMAGTTPVLVLEDFGGAVTLRDALEEYAWPSEKMIPLWMSLTKIVELVHSKNIVHRDINPDNFLVNVRRGEVRIADFGCATRLSIEEQTLQSPVSLEGTLAYFSPEQTGRANRSIDARSDLYSLGVLFYELATGQVPFHFPDAMDLVYAHLARKPQSPQELQPTLPTVLSRVIFKLLEKSAEERYQSAAGLHRDLELAWDQWRNHHRITPFPLGQYDKGDNFRIAEKLYGRDTQVALLLRTLELARSGKPRLLLVDGASGTGKTSVIKETYRDLARLKGYFTRGKCDQFKKNVPFSSLVQAFQELIRQWLTEPDDVLSVLRAQLNAAVGPNGGILIEIIPELHWLLGPPGPVPELGPAETLNRFNNLFRSFLAVCASREHPLVLFLDDLQWADNATLELLRVLMLHAEDESALLVVGAYRTHEVDGSHPLMVVRQALRIAGANIDEVSIAPLGPEHVTQLLSDTLLWAPSDCNELAQLLWTRTRGNPFFLHQFLVLIHKTGGIAFDVESQRWVCQLDMIEARAASGDVVDLLLDRLKQLPSGVQSALGIAACMGSTFRIVSVALALERPTHETFGDLLQAVGEGLIVPVSATGRTLDDTSSGHGRDIYQFVHDRVQQAAYLLVSDETRKHTHLQIARRTFAKISKLELDERLFDIVDHYGEAIDLLTDPGERTVVAELCYRTGVKAKRATAWHPAVKYLEMALSLLPPSAWKSHYELAMDVHRELNECAYLIGDSDTSDRMGTIAIREAKTDLDRVPIDIIAINRRVAQQDLSTAIRTGIRALARLGIHISERPSIVAVLLGIIRVRSSFVTKQVSEMQTGSPMVDQKALACVKIAAALLAPAVLKSEDLLFAMSGITTVLISVKHGRATTTRTGLMAYAMVLNIMGLFRRARAYADVALSISHSEPDAFQDCIIHFSYGNYINHWTAPVRDGLIYLENAKRYGLESGNHQFACYAYGCYTLTHKFMGTRIDEVMKENAKARAFLKRSPDTVFEAGTWAIELGCKLLITTDPKEISYLMDELTKPLNGPEDACFAFFAREAMVLHILFGSPNRPEKVAGAAERTEKFYQMMVGKVTHYAYHSLLIADAADANSGWNRWWFIRLIRRNARKLSGWAARSPQNFSHYVNLVQAELAGVQGEFKKALVLYDAAIDAARKYGFTQDEAIASERAAKRCLASGLPNLARPYLEDAQAAYTRWGATRKVHHMNNAYGRLLSHRDERMLGSLGHGSNVWSNHATKVSQLDIVTALRASQALAGEHILDQLLARLMKLVLENAGAQHGSLILNVKSELRVSATFNSDEVVVGLDHPLDGQPLARGVAQYVAHTLESVVIDDATTDDRFQGDAYLISARVLSVVCLPMVHQGRLIGMIYLEHNDMTRAFPAARVTFLDLIASQAAIAVENALLYAEINATNQTLERQVAARTGELEGALGNLWGEMDLARKIQTVLLPANTEYDGYVLTATMLPADVIGGDYYDIVHAGNVHWILIGDVSGHGVSAGLIMMMIQATARSLILNDAVTSPSELLIAINRAVFENLQKIGSGNYMTLQAFRFHGAEIAYAGLHQDVLVYRADTGRVECRTDAIGTWIGLIPDLTGAFRDDTLVLQPGDVLLLYTDGFTEAKLNGKMIDVAGLEEVLQRAASNGSHGARLIDDLLDSLQPYTVTDDVTLMVIDRIAVATWPNDHSNTFAPS